MSDEKYFRSVIDDLYRNQVKVEPYSEHRQFIMGWLSMLTQKLDACFMTLTRSVKIYDCYLSKLKNADKLDKVELQKISFVCFFITFKLEESVLLSLDFIQQNIFNEATNFIFPIQEIINIERDIIKKLQFRLSLVNVNSFIEVFSEYYLSKDDNIDFLENFTDTSQQICNALFTICQNDQFTKLEDSELCLVILKSTNIFLNKDNKKLKIDVDRKINNLYLFSKSDKIEFINRHSRDLSSLLQKEEKRL
jgi:hypothetical protein